MQFDIVLNPARIQPLDIADIEPLHQHAKMQVIAEMPSHFPL